MNHAITIGGLLLSLGLLAGVVTVGIGVLMILAAGMSDAGDNGPGKSGCIALIAGALLLAGCIVGLVL